VRADRRIVIADQALRDLEAVFEHTRTAFGARQETRYRALVDSAFDKLADAATDRLTRPLSPDHDALRRLPVGGRSPHLLIYRVDVHGQVLVLRLLRAAMDLPRHMPRE